MCVFDLICLLFAYTSLLKHLPLVDRYTCSFWACVLVSAVKVEVVAGKNRIFSYGCSDRGPLSVCPLILLSILADTGSLAGHSELTGLLLESLTLWACLV